MPFVAQNVVLAQQKTVQIGECRQDELIMCELAQRMGLEHGTETPEQVYDRIVTIQDNTHADHFMGVFSYAGMPHDEAERNMKLFAGTVMPELKKLAPAYDRLGAPT